ncbi:hypothetical protein HPB50_010941 [Hyalomma asiaticum]|uniref:Uncharacterized protein n=1 Tax=Hyalomma asiaticum TaxID=266040 RepID=A0ACB7SX69_HYAAI|nr:hypothetical protein HPB50_010941 [Hyalomma asiaticum]
MRVRSESIFSRGHAGCLARPTSPRRRLRSSALQWRVRQLHRRPSLHAVVSHEGNRRGHPGFSVCRANPPGDKVGPDQPLQINNGQPSGARAMKMPNEPTPRQRGRLLAKNSVASNQPRLPSDALKQIVRPRGGLLLSKISTCQLLEAICIAAHFTRDAVHIERAERVLRIKGITIDNKDYEVSVYCAPDDSSGRGVIRGVDLRLDRHTIQAELQDKRNSLIADFRQLGNTTTVHVHTFTPKAGRQSGQAGFSSRQGGECAHLFRPCGSLGCPRGRRGGASRAFAYVCRHLVALRRVAASGKKLVRERSDLPPRFPPRFRRLERRFSRFPPHRFAALAAPPLV